MNAAQKLVLGLKYAATNNKEKIMLAKQSLMGFIFSGLIFSLTGLAQADEHPQVLIKTSMGNITLELDAQKAPKTVANFLQYVDDKFYTNTIFHRVISNFMIQGGGFTPKFQRKQTRATVINEADNGLSNNRGSIAMARTSDPHSASAQFFINVKDNSSLNHTSKTPRGYGYTVFGAVIKGMDIVDAIRRTPTGPSGPFPTDVPKKAVIILGITRINISNDAATQGQ